MLKIGIVSDLHLNHWGRYKNNSESDRRIYPLRSIEISLLKENPALLLDAGDYEEEYCTDYGIPILRIPGNHDYYGTTWNSDSWAYGVTVNHEFGIKIGLITLWVDFNGHDDYLMDLYRRCLADCWAIRNFTPEDAYQTHLKHKQWLLEEHKKKPFDIIVTHHTPTLRAVHPRYTANSITRDISFGFSSDLDDLVLQLSPKYWIFGHTHDPYDFMIGKTRMLSNPCGYPGEHQKTIYEPIYIEIENGKSN